MDKHEIGEEFKALDKKLDKQIRIINRITCVYFHKHKELLSRKRVELIRFGKIDFSVPIAVFFLNIRIFLKKSDSLTKKSILPKLHRTLRRINFRWILA